MLKKVLPWIVFISLFALIIIGIAMKDNFNNYLSEQMQGMVTEDMAGSSEAYVDSAYNYTQNNENYKVTFLEFGAKDCSACKRMESVMEDIRQKFPKSVKVVFLNVLKPKNQDLMKYYGVATIPTQILLDKNGKEFFHNSGYYATEELEKQFIHRVEN